MNLKTYKTQVDCIKKIIQDDILEYFNKVNYNVSDKDFQIIKVINFSDFEKLYDGQGFYIILSDYNIGENKCSFKLKNVTAIYRGHSYCVKKRILSHLLHEQYKLNRKANEVPYTVCLKVEAGVNGINITEPPYKSYDWYVIVHKMRGSDRLTREQAENAFDLKYAMPICSKEKKKVKK